jgi:hypothetical protein
MSKSKSVGKRLHITETAQAAEIRIVGQLEPWKTLVLTLWLIAWLFCGVVVLSEFMAAVEREMKLMLFVFMVFWAYYLWKVGQVWMYRRRGYEHIRLADGEIQITRSIMGAGKTQRYFIENIETLKQIEIPQRSFAFTYENMWWVLGGEKVGFDYAGKFVRFAMQLDEKETQEVLRFLKKNMPRFRKVHS